MTQPVLSNTPNMRRHHSAEFKARIVAACQQPDATVARIALDHGLNANLVHKWIRAARQQAASTPPAFASLALPTQPDPQAAPSPVGSVRIEILRPGGNVVVNWPVAQADRCLLWLQELLR